MEVQVESTTHEGGGSDEALPNTTAADVLGLNQVLRRAILCADKTEPCDCDCEDVVGFISVCMSDAWKWLDEEMSPASGTSMQNTRLQGSLHDWAACIMDLVDDKESFLRQMHAGENFFVTLQLQCDEIAKSVEISLVDSWLYLFPMSVYMLSRATQAAMEGSGRFVVGVGGPAGAGKTTYTEIFRAFSHALMGGEYGHVSTYVLGLDGYHLTNEELEARKMRDIKGLVETFDVAGFVADVKKIHDTNDSVRCPKYSRVLHQPVADKILIGPSPALVLVEGVHVLLTEYGFGPLWDDFDMKLRICAPAGTLKERCTKRKAKSDAPEDVLAAEAHYERVDKVNVDIQLRYRNEDNHHFLLETGAEGTGDPHLQLRFSRNDD